MMTWRCLHFSSCILLIETEPLIMKVGPFSLLSLGSGSPTKSCSPRDPPPKRPSNLKHAWLANQEEVCWPRGNLSTTSDSISTHCPVLKGDTLRHSLQLACVRNGYPGSGLSNMFVSKPCFHMDKNRGKKKQGRRMAYKRCLHFPVSLPCTVVILLVPLHMQFRLNHPQRMGKG